MQFHLFQNPSPPTRQESFQTISKTRFKSFNFDRSPIEPLIPITTTALAKKLEEISTKSPSPSLNPISQSPPLSLQTNQLIRNSRMNKGKSSFSFVNLSTNANSSQAKAPGASRDVLRRVQTKISFDMISRHDQIYSSEEDRNKGSNLMNNFEDVIIPRFEQERTRVSSLLKKDNINVRRKISYQKINQLQIETSKAMDKSTEKLQVQESRSQSPLHKLIRYASQEIQELRNFKLETNPKTPENNTSNESREKFSRSIENSPSFKTRIASSFKPGDKIYHMSASYQPEKDFVYQKSNTSFSRLTNSVEQSILAKAKRGDASKKYNEDFSGQDFDVKKILKHQKSDPFNKIIMYQNGKMPFSLALTAKMRKGLFEEIKRQNEKRSFLRSVNSIATQLRNDLVPEERAKFLAELDKEEKIKQKKELKSKEAHFNTMYQILAMNKSSRKRLRAKLEEQLPVNSRFLNIE